MSTDTPQSQTPEPSSTPAAEPVTTAYPVTTAEKPRRPRRTRALIAGLVGAGLIVVGGIGGFAVGRVTDDGGPGGGIGGPDRMGDQRMGGPGSLDGPGAPGGRGPMGGPGGPGRAGDTERPDGRAPGDRDTDSNSGDQDDTDGADTDGASDDGTGVTSTPAWFGDTRFATTPVLVVA